MKKSQLKNNKLRIKSNKVDYSQDFSLERLVLEKTKNENPQFNFHLYSNLKASSPDFITQATPDEKCLNEPSKEIDQHNPLLNGIKQDVNNFLYRQNINRIPYPKRGTIVFQNELNKHHKTISEKSIFENSDNAKNDSEFQNKLKYTQNSKERFINNNEMNSKLNISIPNSSTKERVQITNKNKRQDSSSNYTN